MRRTFLFAALLLANSCGGGSPTAPTPPATSPRPVVLNSGAYTLSLAFASSGIPVCQNGFCTAISLCGGTPTPVTGQYPVIVSRAGDEVTVAVPATTGSLVLALRVESMSVSGTIDGSARDASGVTVDVTGAVTGAAPADTAIAVSGNINGQMTVPGGACSNNGHAWSLTPR